MSWTLLISLPSHANLPPRVLCISLTASSFCIAARSAFVCAFFFFFLKCQSLKHYLHPHFTDPIWKALKFYSSFNTLLRHHLLYRAFLDDPGAGNFSSSVCAQHVVYIYISTMHSNASLPIASARQNT